MQARNNMRAMQIGDRGFFYHSNEGKDIVGIVEVCALAHPDSTTDDPAGNASTCAPSRTVPNPPTLDEIKANPKLLAKMVLVNNSRLSVQPVTATNGWKSAAWAASKAA
jgi:predicted RNA-binding protein with PUA-like domain